jgi:hypothetical protein
MCVHAVEVRPNTSIWEWRFPPLLRSSLMADLTIESGFYVISGWWHVNAPHLADIPHLRSYVRRGGQNSPEHWEVR